ncbi:MAG TPA: sugar-binding protein [Ignavibacteriaceae bacterium]|nr:sugar-binding protein [Ignavibacteriaceae bacterium]
MKKLSYTLSLFAFTFFFIFGVALKAQGVESWNFEDKVIGDSLPTIGWSASDIQAKIADDPVTPGNNVLQNTIHNYNAAPVLMAVLPAGKTLADYNTFTFKGYFAQGDVGYKHIIVMAYQNLPTGQAYNVDSVKIGDFNRAQMGSTEWENITIDITNTMDLSDTIYLAFGINCAGTGDVGGTGVETIWYADDIAISNVAPPAEFNIVVDGQKDDWYNSLTGPDDGYLQLHFYHGNNNGVATNDADLSAKMWAAWDSTWFYFYTEVKDDTISGSGTTSYNNDGLELKIDPKPLQNTTLTNNTIFPPNLTILGGTNSDSLNNIPDSMKQWARRITPDGYALELAIKWDTLHIAGEKIDVAVDSTFGLAINIHDNDKLVGGSRVATVQWAAVMNDNVWNTPTSLGTAKFLADHKIQFIPKNTISGVENKLPYDATPFAIVVDGQKDWVFSALETPSAQGPNNGYLRFRPWNSNDNGTPVNNADLSSSINAMWDDQWLYLYSDVTDDTVSDGGAANPWEVDNFELKVDPQPTDSTQQQPALWDTRITAPGMSPGDSLNNVADSLKKYVRRLRTGGYAFEIAVKWSAIKSSTGEKVSVGVDSVFGMAINQHDNDGNGRQATEMWGAVMLDAAWNNAKYLGTVKFLPNYRLQFIPENNMTHFRNNLPYDGVKPVDVENGPSAVPASYALGQNYPNPFNPATTIQFSLPENSNIRLVLYDILGREVKVIAKGEYKPGNYKVMLDASNLASGVYFYRLETNNFVSAKKLMLMK